MWGHWWALNKLVIVIFIIDVNITTTTVSVTCGYNASLLIFTAAEGWHCLQFTHEMNEPQKLAQGHRIRRKGIGIGILFYLTPKPICFHYVRLALSFSKSKVPCGSMKGEDRKTLKTEEYKWKAGVSTVVGRVYSEVQTNRFIWGLIMHIRKRRRGEGDFGILATVHCGWESFCPELCAVLRKLGFMFWSCENKEEIRAQGRKKECWHHGQQKMEGKIHVGPNKDQGK